MSSKPSKKYSIVSYTHLLKGKHTNLGGPAQHLAKYLGSKAYCVWQPIPIGKPTWVYALLKIRDIWLFLAHLRHYPKKSTLVAVESINALLGACGRKLGLFSKVIYWNLDYSPNRGLIWSFFDSLAVIYSDEIWHSTYRKLPKKAKFVPIGAWLKKLPKTKRDPKGVVYIGLLEDMQGVEGLIWAGLASKWNITIIGTGKDIFKYKQMAIGSPNIRFTGVISDKEARQIMLKNTYGWAYYHPNNDTIKTTMPTKLITYQSCGLEIWSNIRFEKCKDWSAIFKEALCSH